MAAQPGRGRDARWPSEIPALGWRDICWRVWEQMGKDNVSFAAAGVAFYAMLATFPAISAFVSVFGIFADPGAVREQFVMLRGIIPDDAWRLVNDQLSAVASTATPSLSIGALIGFTIAFWSAGAGVRGMMSALNIAYREYEKRGIVEFYGLAFLFTIGIMFAAIFSLGVIVLVPVVLNLVPLGGLTRILVKVAPWCVLALFITFCLGLLYRYGPSRHVPKTRWVSLGAVLASLLWIGASLGFSIYVSNLASYNQTYGALGAVVILMMWFWISAFVALLGAELNAEMEHQTAQDTTTGRAKPLGQRGAYVADNVGRVP